MSVPLTRRRTRSPSRTSPNSTSSASRISRRARRGCPRSGARCIGRARARSAPWRTRLSQRWLPMKPPAPVTRTCRREAWSWRRGRRVGDRVTTTGVEEVGDALVERQLWRPPREIVQPRRVAHDKRRIDASGQGGIVLDGERHGAPFYHQLGNAAHRDGNAGADVDDPLGRAADECQVCVGDVAYVEVVPNDLEIACPQRSISATFRRGCLTCPLGCGRVRPLARADVVKARAKITRTPPRSGPVTACSRTHLPAPYAETGAVGSSSVASRRGSPSPYCAAEPAKSTGGAGRV